MGRRFCVRCGKEESPGTPIIDGLCPSCFLKERSLVRLPSKIELTICPGCYSLYIKGKWVYVGVDKDEIIKYYINNALIKRESVYPGAQEVRVDEVAYSPGRAVIKVSGEVKGARITQELTTELVIKRRLCPRCLRMKTGSYDALIQIRYEGGLVDRSLGRDVLKLISKYGKLSEAITDVEEVRDGLDIKVMSQSIARQIATIIKREFGAKITQSWEDAGFVSGKRRSKLTISLRLPALRSGDVILIKEEPALVNRIKHGRVYLRRLKDWRSVRLTYDELWELGFKKLTDKDYSIVEGRILNYEGGEAVIQEVISGAIYYARLPVLRDLGSSVTLLIYKGKTYLLR